ncbi:hypothetical protein [Paenibacillus jilunlii]|uniref:Uncharacterized protein n=1 Tax=Paenibacillus jilunlii TaxID=682956 RepID=A0A1G9ZY18_9BACL|nr:hypothetical protein [Paenibacillus jilunlii]KWX79919.1 hypothetical protein AML91_01755 [Paenibacillus jilunlii]SDN26349.1 hypothetical protein SAMN05216191_1344 [Paenibacillus jilunlii]
MLVQEIVEEIIEKLPENTTPVVSILRKITQVRDRLLRNLSPAQAQSDVLNQAFDLTAGNGLTELICPPGNVTEVAIRNAIYTNQSFEDDALDWRRIPLRQFDERERGPYYYFVAGQIGVYPPPIYDTFYGIKIFYTSILGELTLDDLNNGSGFDPDFDMLLVYGVLKDIVPDNGNFYNRYQELYKEYTSATSGYERYVVKERW